MRVEKYYLYARLAVLLLVVATEGKKKNKKKKESQDDEASDVNLDSPFSNLCDIENPTIIYCYCNTVDVDQAEEGNCWIFNDTSEEIYKHVWEGFSTQTKITHLTLHLRPDGILMKIPTVAILHLPDLLRFEVQYATIHAVHSFSFGNSSSIEKIFLARNMIGVLEPYAFANLPTLSSITLGENQLTEVNRTVFSNLPKLTHLFMDRNNITSIEDFAFQELKNLKELELFSNQIQAIVPETFKGLYSLERLDLHKNWIEVLGDMTFQDLKSIRFLDLKGNSIKYVAPKSFYGLNKLQRLVLQDNKLLSLGTEVFKYTPNLMFLDLRQNVLETIAEDTIQPLADNLKSPEMHFYISGNVFRCDTRLLWLFSLYNTTKSRSVKMAFKDVFCYLETGTLPPRLEGVEATPMYEITTMGIGPRTQLLKLHPYELPDPLIRTPATFTQEEDSDHDRKETKHKMAIPTGAEERETPGEESGRRRGKGRKGGGGRGRGGRKNRQQEQTSSHRQNAMSPDPPIARKGKDELPDEPIDGSDPQVHHEMQPAAPVQDPRPYNASARKRAPWCLVSMTTALSLVTSLVIWSR